MNNTNTPNAPANAVPQPQFTLDYLYLTPFSKKRIYDEDGNYTYVALERNLAPTGINVMDALLVYLSKGGANIDSFAARYGLTRTELNGLCRALCGMTVKELTDDYHLRLACDLLRYTDLPIREVTGRSGYGSQNSLYTVLQNRFKKSASDVRTMLRKKGDLNKYKI